MLGEGGPGRRRPGLREIFERQLEGVERELASARDLCERLTAIRDSLGDDGEPSIDQLIETMEAMTMHQKHYTGDQLERLEQRREQLGEQGMEDVQREWEEIFAALRAEMQAGTDPQDPKLEPYRGRARELVRAFTGGEADIAQSLGKVWANEDPKKVSHGMVDRELWDYYTRMCEAPAM